MRFETFSAIREQGGDYVPFEAMPQMLAERHNLDEGTRVGKANLDNEGRTVAKPHNKRNQPRQYCNCYGAGELNDPEDSCMVDSSAERILLNFKTELQKITG